MRNRMLPAMREFLIKLPLVLLMVLGAFTFAAGIYGINRTVSYSPTILALIGLVLLFGPWAILRRIFRRKC